MTEQELRDALQTIIIDAENAQGVGPVDDLQVVVPVGVVRAMLERLA